MEREDWIAAHVLDFFNEICVIYGTVRIFFLDCLCIFCGLIVCIFVYLCVCVFVCLCVCVFVVVAGGCGGCDVFIFFIYFFQFLIIHF